MNVIWNDVILATIIPTDYQVRTKTLIVNVDGGENKLQFEGAGSSNSYGITIDNVRLVRQSTTTNIVINGQFENPDVGHSWGIFNNIPGWEGIGIEVGWGKIYNDNWHSQVLELDGHKNYIITQKWTFDSQFKLVKQIPCSTNNFIGKSLTFKLEFNYAARKNGVASPATSSANVLWNNVVVGTLTPQDYSVKHAIFYVQLKAGENFLQFDGSGASDKLGLNIDGVKLTSKYNNYYNLISNYGYESPSLGAGQWTYTYGGIAHWKAAIAEHGDCKHVYNSNWSSSASQCIELDSKSNQRYTQVVLISQFKFNQFLVNKATMEGDAAIAYEIDCAVDYAENKFENAIEKIEYGVQCQIDMTASDIAGYLYGLYGVMGNHVKHLKKNSQLVLYKYNCLARSYIGHFGQSSQTDFTNDCFVNINLESLEGFIESINGKIIKARDGQGHFHYLQIAPCTHFEGQFVLPKVGHKIFWKGAYQPCGKTYVKYATTCNC